VREKNWVINGGQSLIEFTVFVHISEPGILVEMAVAVQARALDDYYVYALNHLY